MRRPLVTPAEHLLAQTATGSVQTNLRRRRRDAELGGDRLVGKVVDVAQNHDRTEPGRQLGESSLELAAGDCGVGPRLGIELGTGVDHRRVDVELLVLVAPATPECVDAQFAVMRYSHVENCASPRNWRTPR